MKKELEDALVTLSNHFVNPDPDREDEWKCRLCGGWSEEGGPVVHTIWCDLTNLYKRLENEE